jgi:hypothetical protein
MQKGPAGDRLQQPLGLTAPCREDEKRVASGQQSTGESCERFASRSRQNLTLLSIACQLCAQATVTYFNSILPLQC